MSESENSRIELESGATAWHPIMLGSTDVGRGTNIGSMSHIGNNVKIGKDCRIQGSVYIADGCSIGSNVFIGPGATITNDRYPPSGGQWSPVIVEDDVIIGANATIICGVTIGEYALIGAGAVIVKDVPPFSLVVGNPGRIIGKVDKNGNKE